MGKKDGRPMPKSIKTVDIRPFTQPRGSYMYRSLERPWVRAGWRYATDRRIIVRVPADESKMDDAGYYPNAAAVFADFPTTPERPWPKHHRHGTRDEKGNRNFDDMFIPGDPGCLIGGWYAVLIEGLPNVRLVGQIGPNRVQFVFDGGGQGVLIGVDPDTEGE